MNSPYLEESSLSAVINDTTDWEAFLPVIMVETRTWLGKQLVYFCKPVLLEDSVWFITLWKEHPDKALCGDELLLREIRERGVVGESESVSSSDWAFVPYMWELL